MTTTTRHLTSYFEIPFGASRDHTVNGWMAATRDLAERAIEESGTPLWDMLTVDFQEREVEEVRNIVGNVALETTSPARLVLTLPIVVTT